MWKRLSDLHPMFAPDEAAAADGAVDYDNLPDDHQVPVSVLKALRQDLQGKLSAKEKEAAEKDDELLLYKTTVRNLSQGGGGNVADQSPQPASTDPVETFFKDRDPDEPVTVQELRTISAQLTRGNFEQAQLAQVVNQKDFQEVVYTHLPKLIQANPNLAGVIRSLPTQAARFALAYQLGKTEPGYLAKSITDKTNVHVDAEKAKENETKPRSTATVGASGSASSSDMDRIKNARPGTPEFRKLQKEFAQRRRG